MCQSISFTPTKQTVTNTQPFPKDGFVYGALFLFSTSLMPNWNTKNMFPASLTLSIMSWFFDATLILILSLQEKLNFLTKIVEV
jgi:hypothetical protein